MAAAVGTDSNVHMGYVAHIEADIDYDTGFVGKAQTSSALVPAQPKPSCHSSSSRCRLSSLLGADMLSNPSHYALPI